MKRLFHCLKSEGREGLSDFLSFLLFPLLLLHVGVCPSWGEDGKASNDSEPLLSTDTAPAIAPDADPSSASTLSSDVSDGPKGAQPDDRQIDAETEPSGSTGNNQNETSSPASAGPTGSKSNDNEEASLEKALEAAPSKAVTKPVSVETLPASGELTIEKAAPSTTSSAPASSPALVSPMRQSETEDTSKKNEVTNLEFKMEGKISKIVVSFRGTPHYREVQNNQVKQFLFYFDNTSCPQKLQRAYDTSEFVSPVTLFTLLQMGEQFPQSKLIVQLREDKVPSAVVSGNSLVISFPASDVTPDNKAQARSESGEQTEENIYAGGKQFNGALISRLEIKNSDIQDVLRLIAKTSGYNIVIGDDVVGKVGTLSLEKIPWDQAFTLVLQSKKLGYVRQGNVLRVGTLGSLKSEKDEALANEQARIKVEPLKTLLIPVSYAQAQALAPRAKSFLSERGIVEVDTRTNTLIVKDVERMVSRVQKLIAALDTQPPRVSISTKIVEMDDDFKRNIGFSATQFQPTFAGINVNSSFTSGVAGSSVTTITAPNFANFLATLQLQEADNRVKTLANPQVTVVANQQAMVQQSLAFFIPATQIINGSPLVTYNQITTNLTLRVTPIVSSDGVIFLNLQLQNQVPSGPDTQKTITGRTLKTEIMIDNGDTAVIGGIFNSTVTTNRTGVPLLSKIPILGWLFSGESFEDQKGEIYMFLTAKILNADETFKRVL